MWNNKKIKVHDDYGIGGIKGKIITVSYKKDSEKSGYIDTIDGMPSGKTLDYTFPAFGDKCWEIIEEISATPEGCPDLVAGKWYKQCTPICIDIQAIKFKAWDTKYNGCPLHSGVVLTNGTYKLEYNGGGIFNSDFGKALIECSLKEIQQYLPAGHSDKITSKSLTRENLVEGEYYYSEFSSGYAYIFLCSKTGSSTGKHRIGVKDNTFKENYVNSSGTFMRIATPEEKQWLDACIAKNTFVSKEEALKPPTAMYKFEIGQEVNPTKNGYFYCSPEGFYKQSVSEQNGFKASTCSATKGRIKDRKTVSNNNWYLLENYGNWLSEEALEAISSIPEYVECIKLDAHIEVGTIYKVEVEKGDKYNSCSDKTLFINNCPYYQKNFKPSTKEAYEAQEAKKAGIAKAPESLVGRYVKALVNYPSSGATKSRIRDRKKGWSPESIIPTSISITKTYTAMKYPHPIGTKVLYREKEHVIEAYYVSSSPNPDALISGPFGNHAGTGSELADEFGNKVVSDGKNNKYFVPISQLTVIKASPFDTEAIHSRISEIKKEEGDVEIGKVKRMLIPVKTI